MKPSNMKKYINKETTKYKKKIIIKEWSHIMLDIIYPIPVCRVQDIPPHNVGTVLKKNSYV